MKKIKHNLSTIRFFVVILLVAFALNGLVFVQKSGHVEQEDFFEMSLEELLRVEIAMVDEPDVNRMNFFEMPLEQLMTIEVS